MYNFFSIERRGNIVVVTFNSPESSVNTINEAMLVELDQILIELGLDDSIKGLMFRSGKADSFIVGADISMIRKFQNLGGDAAYRASKEGKRILSKLSTMPFPTIALIHGQCLGGGAELALYCNYRLASFSDHSEDRASAHKTDAAIGFPEIKLQLFPGLGGTVRLPKLVGLSNAINLILTGETVNAMEAWRIGLVDAIASPADMITKAESLLADGADVFVSARLDTIRRLLKNPKEASLKELLSLLDKTKLTRKLSLAFSRNLVAKQTRGNYPAPLAALDVIGYALKGDQDKAQERESVQFGRIVNSTVSRAFIDIYLAQQEAKSMSKKALMGRSVKRAGVVGAGVMGAGIVQLLAYSGIPVVLKALTQEEIEAARSKISKLFLAAVSKGKITSAEMAASISLITFTTDLADLKGCDLIIEAIWESLSEKQNLLAALEEVMDKSFVFASNTSSLHISEIAAKSTHPENVIGLHFFNPVHKMKLVEVVRTERSSEISLSLGLDLVLKVGRTPVLTSDSTGFLVNRILTPYMLEALRMVQSGVSPLDIDSAMKKFGMPMGPLALIDEVGIDISGHVLESLYSSFGERFLAPSLISGLMDLGVKGKKSGKGIYLYDKPNGSVMKDKKSGKGILNEDVTNLVKAPPCRKNVEEIQDRLVYVMLNEAAKCLSEGVISSPLALDLAIVYGTGFPPYRGGLMHYADSLGLPVVLQNMSRLALNFGENYQPAELISRMAKESKTFLPTDS